MWRCFFATVFFNITVILPSGSAEKSAYITLQTCAILPPYIPADDVAYKTGVDGRGKPVTPADLPARNLFPVQNHISFMVIPDAFRLHSKTRKAQNQHRGPFHHPGVEAPMPLGLIEIRDGVVLLDGQPLAANQHQQLSLFCEKHKKQP